MLMQMARESNVAQEYCVLRAAGAELAFEFRIVTFVWLPLGDDRHIFRSHLLSLERDVIIRARADSELPQNMLDSLVEPTEATQNELNHLESYRKTLNDAKLFVIQEITRKRKRDVRLFQKCARSISSESMMQLAVGNVPVRVKCKAKAAPKAHAA